LIQNLLDTSCYELLGLVDDIDCEFDFLSRVKRRPESRDGEETMKSNLIVSGWLHPFEGGEFRLKLFIIADDRFVVAFAADFVAGRRKD
jgi:hypothetical protein